MPIEIKELIIKAFVDSDEDKDSYKKEDDKSSCNKSTKKQAVSESISQMVYLMKNKNER